MRIDVLNGVNLSLVTFAQAAASNALSLVLEFKSGVGQHGIGRFRISQTDAADPSAVQPVPDDLRAASVCLKIDISFVLFLTVEPH